MAFALIYQLKNKKVWWLDAIMYFSLAILLAAIICYFIFSIKISFQEQKLKQLQELISKTGTKDQLALEKKVFEYQEKINDFTTLLNNHAIPSNFFTFLEQTTLPKVRFTEVKLNKGESKIRLSGTTQDAQMLAQQTYLFQESQFIQDTKLFLFSLGEGGKITFSVIFSLNPQIFQWK
ncbi:MAG: hypothetical protein COU98_00715 [Candidatus Staskawiczbacteria bacterium CG10_big_fil_rev_8_21_14_0_10_38_10]|uniref:PilN domain-containing protein n=1 Tax=Candidatus Staskawiczbacteria bacterium CG10_big_fil_rev_8_21_14_0_10_38_10 TaxID=1974891 RepID=A0A2H9T1S6_9BACT|nr:MAG: hypothetical protein COU98_00715 [Candidatus Staskawiczbacteria bacterium CG10_big_fil_rev_8_21_14_0_10_38_10]